MQIKGPVIIDGAAFFFVLWGPDRQFFSFSGVRIANFLFEGRPDRRMSPDRPDGLKRTQLVIRENSKLFLMSSISGWDVAGHLCMHAVVMVLSMFQLRSVNPTIVSSEN